MIKCEMLNHTVVRVRREEKRRKSIHQQKESGVHGLYRKKKLDEETLR